MREREGLYRFALVTVGATFVLIVLGALVTSNEAGDSVPDWPTAFGRWLPLEQIVGNVVYEYTHRVVAATVGLLTLLLNVGLWWKEERAWVRRLGLIALLAVLGQAALGGARVLLLEHRFVFALIHAFMAQFFFGLTVSLAVVTSPTWRRFETSELETRLPAYLPKLCSIAIVGLFVQLLLGAGFRHRGLGILPHILGAIVVSALILAIVWGVRKVAREHGAALRVIARPAQWTAGLLGVQLGLGIAAYLARRAARFDPQPLEPMVSLTVAHVACGALLLAALLVLTWRIFWLSGMRRAEPVLQPVGGRI
ncbi:MAG: COX15/CtaA family protein [Blastocatellia bacterium]|nr:COX15/CtaA family protein [Blastocatellia bacterium]MCS7158279.1 COX15/CtaA family protein [Blastocatellia bacterium]MCX7753117.1 COX15/CtaA family protein [Blastocatellia bacterium]MDW8169431.1 COX15/CtaA family protein [Acidobacteriota bacterium]MDW8255706.1 COX15/CtaA family protein [Acidobacteriota bacterium]